MIGRISVIGLGKLGAPMAAASASRGLRVIGVDADTAKVQALHDLRAPVFEPGLPELLRASAGRLSATQNIEEAVRESDATFIVVATPSEPSGGFSLKYVLPVCEAVGRALRSKRDFHVVALTSTVMPGTTGGPVREALEHASGNVAGRNFGLCYNPEFIALGTVIRDFLNPDFLLIGESDPKSGELLEDLYRRVCENKPTAAHMNFVNAEVTKLAVNTYITTKISYANMLARICERLPNADVDVVTSALGLDQRIGGKYLKGAISYGGPCFPRDNLALAALADLVGAPDEIARMTHHFNRGQIAWLADLAQKMALPGETIGILGLTYKSNTDVVEQAPGLLLAEELVSRGVAVAAADPAGSENARRVLGERVRFLPAAECITDSSVVVVTTAWAEFQQIPLTEWTRPVAPSRNGSHSQAGGERTVIDCWRALPQLRNAAGVRYMSLGVGNLARAAASPAVSAT